jgi:2-oxoisovalerate dehydrogenase E1 component
MSRIATESVLEAASSSERPALIQLYRQMLLIRLAEERLAKSHQRGLIPGACHTYVGQEAVAVGVCAELNQGDMVFSTHRGHGHALAKGLEARQLFAELYGRAAGCSRGRGGSMHLFAPEIGVMGTSGIVGPCILQAAGAGYSFKLLNDQHVAVAFFGDGAANNGAFHEGLNMASIWELPVIFVCENNQYATEVPLSYSAGIPRVHERGAAYGLPSMEVDGNNVLAVQRAAQVAVKRARSGGGSTLIECKTYRVRPHAEGMGDFGYRTREEVDHWKKQCPIASWKNYLLQNSVADPAELEEIDAEVAALVEEAHEFAEKSPMPTPESAATHIFSVPSPRLPVPVSGNGNGNGAPHHENSSRVLTYMKATLEALTEEFAKNPKLFVLGEGIGERGGNFATTAGLYKKYGKERLCDTPICERGFVGLACGAAMSGTRPVVDFMFADFVLDGAGEIINQIAKMQYMSSGRLKMPILLRGCIGIGHSAATHHSGSYYAMYAQFPGLRVVVPSNPRDAKGLLKTALNCDDPVIFLEHRELLSVKGEVPAEEYFIEFGKASVVREGKDITVVALALMVHKTLQACEILAKEDISVELIDPRTVAPLDVETILNSVAKTGRLLIVDESFSPCGVGAEIAARLADCGFDDLDAPIRRLNGLHTPTPYSPTLETAVTLNVDAIVKAVRELVEA